MGTSRRFSTGVVRWVVLAVVVASVPALFAAVTTAQPAWSVTYLAADKDGSVWLALEMRGNRTALFRTSTARPDWEKMLEVSGRGTIRRLWFFGSGRLSAWLDAPHLDGVGVVMRSTDGGMRWSSARELPGPGEGGGFVTFVSPTEGWMLLSTHVAMSQSWPALYYTRDGGDHWTEIARVDPGGPRGTSGLSAEYKTGIVFHDTDNGWIGTQSGAVTVMPRLYMSRNGGKTWKVQVLPPPTDARVEWSGNVRPPVFFGPRAGIVLAWLLEGNKETSYVYTTTDAGRTWGNPRPLPVSAGDSESGRWDFFGPAVWGVGSERTLWLSSNAGRTWSQHPVPLPATHKIERIVFVGSTHIWVVGSGGYLFETSDRGLHWQRVPLPQVR